MSTPDWTGKWAYSFDEENYSSSVFASRAEVVAELQDCDRAVWIGQCKPVDPPELFFTSWSVEEWLKSVLEQDEYSIEAAEGSLNATRDQTTELAEEIRPIISAWLDRHGLRPRFYLIDEATVERVK